MIVYESEASSEPVKLLLFQAIEFVALSGPFFATHPDVYVTVH